MAWLERDGIAIRYEVSGAGPETLVLVHEMGGTLEGWDLVLPYLNKNIRTLRFDMRGHGLSSKLRGTADIRAMASDVAALLDAAAITAPVVVAGVAVGGAVALAAAARYPARIKGVVALGPATFVPAERRPSILDYADRVEQGGMAAAAEFELGRAYPEEFRLDVARYETYRSRWLGNDPGSYAAVFRMLSGLDMDEELASIRSKTLLLAGTSDPLRPPEMIEAVSRKIAGSRFEALQTGHYAATLHPDAVAGVLNRFITEPGR
jgi:3-oxoadipate enol-lactonase